MPWVAKLIDKDGVERFVNDQHEEGVVETLDLAEEYETPEAALMAGATAAVDDDRSVSAIEVPTRGVVGAIWRAAHKGIPVVVIQPPPGRDLTEAELVNLYRQLPSKDR